MSDCCPECLVQKLDQEAQSWIGTPFVPRARVKRAGVDCTNLALACFQGAGIVPDSVQLPKKYPMDGGHHLALSWVEEFIEKSGLFVLIPGAKTQPGDLLALRLSLVSHHVAMVLPNDRIIHALETQGVVEGSLRDPSIRRIIRRIYRPKVLINLKTNSENSDVLAPCRNCS